jgi:hypothetical protein
MFSSPSVASFSEFPLIGRPALHRAPAFLKIFVLGILVVSIAQAQQTPSTAPEVPAWTGSLPDQDAAAAPSVPMDPALELDADPGVPPPPPPTPEPGGVAVDDALDTMRSGIRPPIVRQPVSADGPNADLELLNSSEASMGLPAENNFFLPEIGDAGWFQMEGLKFRVGPVHARITLGTSVEYNSNIFARSEDPEGDYVSQITPSITLGTGGWRGEAKNFARLTYTPSFVFYANNLEKNTLNQNLEFAANYELSRYTTDLSVGFSSSDQPNATQSGLSQYSTLSASWDNSYLLASKVFARANLGYLLQDYSNSDDYTTYTVSPQLAYAFSPRITVFAGPFAGISYVGDNGTQPFQGLSLGVTYDSLSKLSGEFVFGVQARQYQGETFEGAKDFITPIFSFELNYKVREQTNLSFGISRDVQISDLLQGLTYVNNQVDFRVTQRIYGKIDFSLGLTYQLLQYEGDGPDGRDDNYLAVTPQLSYTFWRDQLTFSVYYRRQQLVSDVSSRDYNINAIGTGLMFRF